MATLGPGPIRPPDALPYSFQWRQRVTAKWPTGTQAFDAVLIKQKGELRMVGLSPMGVPGFVITLQRDGSVQFENRTRREPTFQPEFILADVQRVFFPWLPGDAPEGEREGQVEILRVSETHEAGRLMTREFVRDDAPDRGTVRITYSDWPSEGDAPKKVELVSEWFGYSLTIETLEQSRL